MFEKGLERKEILVKTEHNENNLHEHGYLLLRVELCSN